MTAGRLPPASVAGQQTQIFHISTGTRRNNNGGYLSFADTFPRITIRGSWTGALVGNDKF
jgi:hypothetical protein